MIPAKRLLEILMKRYKMGLFNNVGRYSDIHEYIKNFKEQTQSGLKLDSNNNYDIEGKRLANVGQGLLTMMMQLSCINLRHLTLVSKRNSRN